MKTYGSAVLTSLQAQHKSIEEIEKLINHRRLQAFIKGGNPIEWLGCFWQQMAILEANTINVNKFIFYDPITAKLLRNDLRN